MTAGEQNLAKFWSRVDIPKGSNWRNRCWEWTGALTTKWPGEHQGGGGQGYGALKVDGKWWRAHRYAYVNYHGEIPEDYVIGHRCNNRKCVNPLHIAAVTLQQNAQHTWSDECPF